jgi:hypothetical protein
LTFFTNLEKKKTLLKKCSSTKNFFRFLNDFSFLLIILPHHDNYIILPCPCSPTTPFNSVNNLIKQINVHNNMVKWSVASDHWPLDFTITNPRQMFRIIYLSTLWLINMLIPRDYNSHSHLLMSFKPNPLIHKTFLTCHVHTQYCL